MFWFLVLLMAIVCLGMVAAMLWTPLPTWLINRAVDRFVEDGLEADIEIVDVGGNFRSEFSLEEIDLRTRDGQLRVRISILTLEYDWRDLLRRHWRLRGLYFQEPVVELAPGIPGEDREGEPAPAAATLLPALPACEVQKLRIEGGEVSDTAGTILDRIGLEMSLKAGGDRLQAQLHRCRAMVPRIGLPVRDLAGELEISGQTIHVARLEARTSHSTVAVAGWLVPRPVLACSLQVHADSLSLGELAGALRREDIPDGWLRLDGRVRGRGESWEGDVQLTGEVGRYDLEQVSTQFTWHQGHLQLDETTFQNRGARLRGRGFYNTAATEPEFEAHLSLKDVDLSWAADRIPATWLNGQVMVLGRGRSAGDLEGSATVDLSAGVVAGYDFQALRGEVQYRDGTWNIPRGVEVFLEGGELLLNGSLDSGRNLDVMISAEVDRLGPLLRRPSLSASLQAQVQALGPLSDPKLAGLVQLRDIAQDDRRLSQLRGTFGTSGAVSREKGFFAVRFFDGQAGGVILDEGRIRGRLNGDSFFVDSLAAEGPQGRIAAKGRLDIVAGGFDVHIEPLQGSYLGSGFSATAPLTVNYRDGQVLIEETQFAWEGGTLTARGSYGPDRQVQAWARLRGLQLEPMSRFLPGAHQLSGSVSGDLSLDGSATDPHATMNVLWQQGRFDRVAIDHVETDLAYRHGLLTVETLQARREDAQLHGKGTLPVDLSRGGLLRDRPWDVTITGEGRRMGFVPLLIRDVQSLRGPFTTEMRARGTPDDPKYDGFFRLSDGTLRLATLGDAIQDLDVQAHLDGQYLVIEGIRGTTPIRERSLLKRIWRWIFPSQKKGRFEITGRINLADLAYDVAAKGKKVYINYLEEQSEAVSDFNVRITGRERPLLSGQVTVSRALISRPMNSSSRAAPGTAPPSFDTDLTVNIPKNCWMRNEAAEVELRGQLRVIQNLEGLGMLGGLETIRGSYFFYGNTFHVDRGLVTFDDQYEIDPQLDVRAWTQVDRERVDLAIGGRLKSPSITLTSSSGYSEHDILSLLAIHRSAGELDTLGTGDVVVQQAESFFGSYLREAFNRKASQFLGVDKFTIRPGSESKLDITTAELTVGTYLSSRVYVEYSRRLSQESGEQVGVEYSLSRNLSLDGKRDKNGLYRLGLNVRWDY
jgi:autotransporter translocation and assembly factor TamB